MENYRSILTLDNNKQKTQIHLDNVIEQKEGPKINNQVKSTLTFTDEKPVEKPKLSSLPLSLPSTTEPSLKIEILSLMDGGKKDKKSMLPKNN